MVQNNDTVHKNNTLHCVYRIPQYLSPPGTSDAVQRKKKVWLLGVGGGPWSICTGSANGVLDEKGARVAINSTINIAVHKVTP